MFSPNRVPTVSKKEVQVQKKFRRDAFIFELGELRRAARSLCQSAGKTLGPFCRTFTPNVGANRDTAKNGFGGVLTSRVGGRSGTQPRLPVFMYEIEI
jgi:hypothetical protein